MRFLKIINKTNRSFENSLYTLASELFHTHWSRGALCEKSSWCTLHGPSWFASHISMCWMLYSCNPSWFVCNVFVCRRSTACVFIRQCHWGSSSAPSLYHVRLMKASPKLPFIVVIVIFSILFSSCCSYLFFVESLLYTQQNIYQNIDLLKCLWNYLSNEWSFILNGFQTRELCPFHFWHCVLSRNFQSAQPSMFWPYPLVGISDWLDS